MDQEPGSNKTNTTSASATPSFACPRCDAALTRRSDALHCAGCHVTFPLIGGIPWLFAEPLAALGEWQSRCNFERRRLEQAATARAAALRRSDLAAATRARLAAECTALTTHAGHLTTLLEPLQLPDPPGRIETYLALRTRPPSDQGLVTYYQNLHRDWVWGEEENNAALNILRTAFADKAPGRTLVLGSGAGRLAYDVHMQLGTQCTTALDFNPLLVLIADRVMRGERIELHEFPIAPVGEFAVLNTLSAPGPVREGFHHVIGDANRPPFADASFDTVITPWLIDILGEPLHATAARVNALLAPGGRWINFGSLNFQHADPALCLNLDECRQVVRDAGFAEPATHEDTMAYMNSPASRHGRLETVVSWSATKSGKAARGPERHNALPDWLVRGDTPVPRSEHVATQAFATRIHTVILSLADGQRSVKAIAALLAEQKLMHQDEAEAAVRGFFIRVYEDEQRARLL